MSDVMDTSYLDAASGQGFESMEQDMVMIPYVSLLQTTSDVVQAGEQAAGNFYNNVTRENYGPTIRVIVCGFKTCWSEKDSMGRTVRRHPFGTTEIEGNRYKGAYLKGEKDRKLVETWLYQLILPDYTDIGFAIYASTPGNMRYLKAWDTQMRFLHLPSGKPAQIHSSIWELTANTDQNKEGKKYFSFKDGIRRIGWVPQVLYEGPVIAATKKTDLLLAAPIDSSADADEGAEEDLDAKY